MRNPTPSRQDAKTQRREKFFATLRLGALALNPKSAMRDSGKIPPFAPAPAGPFQFSALPLSAFAFLPRRHRTNPALP
jgi:hypothetical protein